MFSPQMFAKNHYVCLLNEKMNTAERLGKTMPFSCMPSTVMLQLSVMCNNSNGSLILALWFPVSESFPYCIYSFPWHVVNILAFILKRVWVQMPHWPLTQPGWPCGAIYVPDLTHIKNNCNCIVNSNFNLCHKSVWLEL